MSETVGPWPERPPFELELLSGRVLDMVARPLVMGVLNVTPDSFSDGGRFFDRGSAVAHARQMCAEGADIIDVGGESTRPGSERVSPAEEMKRVVPVINELAAETNVAISIDTQKSEVAAAALDAGAEHAQIRRDLLAELRVYLPSDKIQDVCRHKHLPPQHRFDGRQPSVRLSQLANRLSQTLRLEASTPQDNLWQGIAPWPQPALKMRQSILWFCHPLALAAVSLAT